MMIHHLSKAIAESAAPVGIHVVGAGGTGAHFVTGLARMNAALVALGKPGLHVTLFDPDTVSESNLGRTPFSPADVGLPKADVLIHRLNLFFGLAWESQPSLYEPQKSAEIVVGCVDTKAARRSINSAAQAFARYWLDMGNDATTGQVVLGQPVGSRSSGFVRDRLKDNASRLPTILELCPDMANRRASEDDTPSCSMAEALQRQDLFVNQTLASHALHLLWTLLRHGQITHHAIFLNLATGRTAPVPCDPAAWKRMGVKRWKPKKRIQRAPRG